MEMSSGKWYFEVTRGSGTYGTMGICTADTDLSEYAGRSSAAVGGYEIYTENDKKWAGGSGGTSGYLTVDWDTDGGVASCYFDADNGTIGFMVNGTDMGTAYSGIDTTKTYFFQCGSGGTELDANFGQRDFEETVPTGFKALNTFNLDPAIDDPSLYFDIGLDAGADILSTATGLTDGADFVWIKDRANSSTNHILFNRINDSGMDGTPHLRANEDDDESTCGTYSAPSGNSVSWVWNAGSSNTTVSVGDYNSSTYNQDQNWTSLLTSSAGTISNPSNSFNGDTSTTSQLPTTSAGSYIQFGVTLTNVTKLEVYQRSNSDISGTGIQTYNNAPATQWVELTLTSSTVSNIRLEKNTNDPGIYAIRVNNEILVDSGVTPPNAPSIASTVRANTTAGFSIVSYEGNYTAGATVGHGLNSAIDFILFKNRESTYSWAVYHSAVGATHKLRLDLTEAATTTGMFEDTEPTSSVFTVGDTYSTNKSGDDMLALVWSEVEGFSKFGSYEGNSDPDGPFIWCGFKPRWVMVKVTSTTNSWVIVDSERDTYNIVGQRLRADLNNAEDTQDAVDFVSNGFKIRTDTASTWNDSETYIYCAWAESPFKYSNAR